MKPIIIKHPYGYIRYTRSNGKVISSSSDDGLKWGPEITMDEGDLQDRIKNLKSAHGDSKITYTSEDPALIESEKSFLNSNRTTKAPTPSDKDFEGMFNEPLSNSQKLDASPIIGDNPITIKHKYGLLRYTRKNGKIIQETSQDGNAWSAPMERDERGLQEFIAGLIRDNGPNSFTITSKDPALSTSEKSFLTTKPVGKDPSLKNINLDKTFTSLEPVAPNKDAPSVFNNTSIPVPQYILPSDKVIPKPQYELKQEISKPDPLLSAPPAYIPESYKEVVENKIQEPPIKIDNSLEIVEKPSLTTTPTPPAPNKPYNIYDKNGIPTHQYTILPDGKYEVVSTNYKGEPININNKQILDKEVFATQIATAYKNGSTTNNPRDHYIAQGLTPPESLPNNVSVPATQYSFKDEPKVSYTPPAPVDLRTGTMSPIQAPPQFVPKVSAEIIEQPSPDSKLPDWYKPNAAKPNDPPVYKDDKPFKVSNSLGWKKDEADPLKPDANTANNNTTTNTTNMNPILLGEVTLSNGGNISYYKNPDGTFESVNYGGTGTESITTKITTAEELKKVMEADSAREKNFQFSGDAKTKEEMYKTVDTPVTSTPQQNTTNTPLAGNLVKIGELQQADGSIISYSKNPDGSYEKSGINKDGAIIPPTIVKDPEEFKKIITADRATGGAFKYATGINNEDELNAVMTPAAPPAPANTTTNTTTATTTTGATAAPPTPAPKLITIGKDTKEGRIALQKAIGAKVDGAWGKESIGKLAEAIKAGGFKSEAEYIASLNAKAIAAATPPTPVGDQMIIEDITSDGKRVYIHKADGSYIVQYFDKDNALLKTLNTNSTQVKEAIQFPDGKIQINPELKTTFSNYLKSATVNGGKPVSFNSLKEVGGNEENHSKKLGAFTHNGEMIAEIYHGPTGYFIRGEDSNGKIVHKLYNSFEEMNADAKLLKGSPSKYTETLEPDVKSFEDYNTAVIASGKNEPLTVIKPAATTTPSSTSVTDPKSGITTKTDIDANGNKTVTTTTEKGFVVSTVVTDSSGKSTKTTKGTDGKDIITETQEKVDKKSEVVNADGSKTVIVDKADGSKETTTIGVDGKSNTVITPPAVAKPNAGFKTKEEIARLQEMIGMDPKDWDGDNGPKTKEAIEAYKKKNNIKSDDDLVTHLNTPKTADAAKPAGPPPLTANTTPQYPINDKSDAGPAPEGTIKPEDVIDAEKGIAPVAGDYNYRATNGNWEDISKEGRIQYRTRPMFRVQNQDTALATVVNEGLGKVFGTREQREDRRNDRQERRLDAQNQKNTTTVADDKEVEETPNMSRKERWRQAQLERNPMLGIAQDVLKDETGIVPEFDNIKDARKFHRAVKTAQTWKGRDEQEETRNKARSSQQADRLAAIRARTAERLGRSLTPTEQAPNAPVTPAGDAPVPIIAPLSGEPRKADPIPLPTATPAEMTSKSAYNTWPTPETNSTINSSAVISEPEKKQMGGYAGFMQKYQTGGYTKPLLKYQDGNDIKNYQAPQYDIKNPFAQKGDLLNRPNNANYRFDGTDEMPEHKFKSSRESLLNQSSGRDNVYGDLSKATTMPIPKVNPYDHAGNKYTTAPPLGNTENGPINLEKAAPATPPKDNTDESKAPYWNPRRLNVFGNQMQHEANMYPVMYNVGKSLFDKAEVQNPIYNKQEVAFLQGMKRNQIATNMNQLNDNRAMMNQAIRGNARGSGQILSAMQANANASSRAANEEQYRVKNTNQAAENAYLTALNEVGSNRREINTLVDEKNRQHRLAFDKFQRDALESGEKAAINKGQMLNQELSDKISMDGYLNQIGKNFKYKAQRDGTYLLEFVDNNGVARTMNPYQTKETLALMEKRDAEVRNEKIAALNAEEASKKAALAASEAAKTTNVTSDADKKALAEKAAEEKQKQDNIRIEAEVQKRLQEKAAAEKAASGKQSGGRINKFGGYTFRRKVF